MLESFTQRNCSRFVAGVSAKRVILDIAEAGIGSDGRGGRALLLIQIVLPSQMCALRPCIPHLDGHSVAKSLSIVRFQLSRYGDGGFTSYPLVVVTPESFAREAGNGFASVNRAGLLVDPVKLCEREYGKAAGEIRAHGAQSRPGVEDSEAPPHHCPVVVERTPRHANARRKLS